MQNALTKSFARVRAVVAENVDGRAVAAIMGLALLSSCSTEQQSSASSPLLGVYRQIDRVGRPGVKEIFESYADHESSNRSSPSSDPALSAAIETYMAGVVGSGSTSAIAAVRDTFSPDALQANLDDAATTAGYLGLEVPSVGNGFGGRAIADKAMQLDLRLAYSKDLDGSAADVPCLQTDNNSAPATAATTSFPYLTNS